MSLKADDVINQFASGEPGVMNHQAAADPVATPPPSWMQIRDESLADIWDVITRYFDSGAVASEFRTNVQYGAIKDAIHQMLGRALEAEHLGAPCRTHLSVIEPSRHH
jgi:hypothetical protein